MVSIRSRILRLEKVAPGAGTVFVLRERKESMADFQRRVKAAQQSSAKTVFSLNMGGA